ncbi:hypothetical protein V1639_07745 [Pseudarthrobacter sp. J75]|nr:MULTISPECIES: hypothetical protein [unclassified Pseudarthrobacter]MEE2521995.1 hypothetical protein [Pseudarthrobacter sp. J47]MEE2528920.1 hypothetical protein [Pseudarthrobacter sp. J75]MEE2570275.1 hypothetical protein [Pseudarthrobacter sp. J64]
MENNLDNTADLAHNGTILVIGGTGEPKDFSEFAREAAATGVWGPAA